MRAYRLSKTFSPMSFWLATLPAFCLSAKASPYAAGGRCGQQNNNIQCGPDQGCCSVNGWCGFSDDYCLASNGCQSSCTNGTGTATPSPSTASHPPLSDGMIGMIVGVSVGFLIFVVICFLIWRKLQNNHALDLQKRDHAHDYEMQESRNRGVMLRLADSQEGLRALQLLGVGGNGGTANRLAIGPGNGPHAGGGGGRVFEDD